MSISDREEFLNFSAKIAFTWTKHHAFMAEEPFQRVDTVISVWTEISFAPLSSTGPLSNDLWVRSILLLSAEGQQGGVRAFIEVDCQYLPGGRQDVCFYESDSYSLFCLESLSFLGKLLKRLLQQGSQDGGTEATWIYCVWYLSGSGDEWRSGTLLELQYQLPSIPLTWLCMLTRVGGITLESRHFSFFLWELGG